MKAILVIDMPRSCFECKYRKKVSPDDIECVLTGEWYEETFKTIQTRMKVCPLKPISDDKVKELENESN